MVRLENFSWLDGPSKTGPKKENIRILKDKSLNSQPHLGLTEVIATRLAIEALEKYERRHVETLVPQMSGSYLKELPFRIFDELDKELFRGVLQKNVYMRWANLPNYVHGRTLSAGSKAKRVTIELNTVLVRMNAPPSMVFASLLHQMVHAYFFVCCGPPKEGASDGKSRIAHGLGFSSLAYKIKDVFAPRSRNRLPDLFTCFSGDPRWYYASSRFSRKKRSSETSSLCCWGIRDFPNKKTCEGYLSDLKEVSASQKKEQGKGEKSSSKDENEKGKDNKDRGKDNDNEKTVDPYPKSHYLHTVNTASSQFTPVLRAQYSLKPTDYVEIHYQNYAVPIPRRNMNNFPSLVQRFAESKESSILTALNSTPTSIFLALYSYVFEFDYPPSLKLVLSSTLGAKAGPPVIETYNPSDPPYLLTDIQVYALASKLRFAELRSKALGRLYAQSVTRNDPMAALEKIYQGKDIEVEEDKHALRAWVRAFLSKTHSDGQTTNIGILQKSEQWKGRFAALRLRGGQFLEDCDAANECIAVKASLMKMVGGAKHGGSQNGGSGETTNKVPHPSHYDHRPENHFHVSQHPPPSNLHDLDPEHFDLYGLPPLGPSSRCSSPDYPKTPVSQLHQLHPSILHQLNGYSAPTQFQKDAAASKYNGVCEQERKSNLQGSSPPGANNPFGNQDNNQGGFWCQKCVRN